MLQYVLDRIPTDRLISAVTDKLGAHFRQLLEPGLEAARSALLESVTGTPPPNSHGTRAAQGWPIDDAGAAVLWRALIAAAAGPYEAPPPHLELVHDSPESVCG